MNKNYEQPNVSIMTFKEDVIRTSTPGVGDFNPDWLSDFTNNNGNA